MMNSFRVVALLVGFVSGTGLGLERTPIDATNKTGAVALTNASYPWVNDSNAFWSGTYIARYNRAQIRLTNWTRSTLTFEEICTTTAFSDLRYAIVVDGALYTSVAGTGDRQRHTHVVEGIPFRAAGSVVEIWEPWGTIGALNTGADAPVEGGYITGVWTARGPPIAATAPTAIVVIGDSIIGAVLGSSPESMGVTGQLRLLAEARGWLLVDLDYGGATLRGDGITPAQRTALIRAIAAATGATTVKVVWAIGRNDWSNYGATISSTPTQVAADIQTSVTSLTSTGSPSYTHVVITPIPQTSEAANGGGFVLGAYRTSEATVSPATIVDSTACNIFTGVDLADGVHFNAGGVTKGVACDRGAIGL